MPFLVHQFVHLPILSHPDHAWCKKWGLDPVRVNVGSRGNLSRRLIISIVVQEGNTDIGEERSGVIGKESDLLMSAESFRTVCARGAGSVRALAGYAGWNPDDRSM
jgi:hypothetical protein